jgi:hypothetical protein
VKRSAFIACAAAALALTACDKKKDDAPPPSGSATGPLARAADAGPPKLEKVEVPEVRIKPGATTSVKVTWITPAGTGVNDDAPFHVRWNRSDGLMEAPADVKATGAQVKNGFSVKVQPMAGAPNATLSGEINIVVCDDATHSVCVPVRRAVELGFVAAKDAASEATVAIPLPAAK